MTIHAWSRRESSLRYSYISLANTLLLALATLLAATQAHAQGCVVAHGCGLPMALEPNGNATQKWDVSVSYRWFQSDRHFVGTVEQKQRATAGDQVINRSNFTDFGLNYTFSSRYSLSLTIPYVSHDRSQVVKNSSGVILNRFHTQASGFADLSLVGNAWVFNPENSRKGNLQFGAGLTLPTGQDDVRATFQTFDKTAGQIVTVQRSVDQSIQPGSGGYGLVLSAYGYRLLGAGFTSFLNASYTITPQEDNGVPTFRSSVYESIMSIPDTYLARLGLDYQLAAVPGLSLSLALRVEGVSVNDLIGGSKGFRRPGYSVGIEPGLSLSRQRWSARLYVPYAIQRNRQQSVPDKQKTAATGVYSQGDAAFADYLVLLSCSYKL